MSHSVFNFYPHALGRDLWIPFNLSNFLQKIFQLASSKGHQRVATSTSGVKLLFLVFHLTINVIRMCTLRHYKMVFKISKIYFSRTSYLNFDLKRLLSLFYLTFQVTIRFIIKIGFLRKSKLWICSKNLRVLSYMFLLLRFHHLEFHILTV